MTAERFGILPCSSRGRITSSSMPLTPITTTWGLGLAELCPWPNRGRHRRPQNTNTKNEGRRNSMKTSLWDQESRILPEKTARQLYSNRQPLQLRHLNLNQRI